MGKVGNEHVSRQAKLMAEMWGMSGKESEYLIKRLAHCRQRAVATNAVQAADYAALYGCLETGAKAKQGVIKEWQESFTVHDLGVARDFLNNMEEWLLKDFIINAAEELVVPTGVRLGGVRDLAMRSAGVVKFFKKARRAIETMALREQKLGRFVE